MNMKITPDVAPGPRRYNRLLLLVAGLGGMLYGVDVGIIAGALPYLQVTSGLPNPTRTLAVRVGRPVCKIRS